MWNVPVIGQMEHFVGNAIDHVDSIIVVITVIATLAFMAIVVDNDNGWNVWRMFFTDSFNDNMSTVNRKKDHSYRGGFGVHYGTGESTVGTIGLFECSRQRSGHGVIPFCEHVGVLGIIPFPFNVTTAVVETI